jgi:hypothetical protein
MSADHSQSTTVRPTDQLLILHIRQEASRFSELILCIRQEASRFRELNLRTVMKIHGFASSSSVSVKKMRGFASSAPNPSVDSGPATILNTPSAGIDADIVDYEDLSLTAAPSPLASWLIPSVILLGEPQHRMATR